MNERHLTYLASPAWADALRTELAPWLDSAVDIGDDVLEIGPGPGLTTDLLSARAASVTAVEADAGLAEALVQRLAGTNVAVIHGDGTALELAADRFSAATCFSMLHHMPTAQAQDRLFAELRRVLRPGAALVGIDAVDTERMRAAHTDDTFVPVDPATLGERLRRAGYVDVVVDVVAAAFSDYQIRFTAAKPGASC